MFDGIGFIVISLSRCCLPNDEGPDPQIFFLEPPLIALLCTKVGAGVGDAVLPGSVGEHGGEAKRGRGGGTGGQVRCGRRTRRLEEIRRQHLTAF